MKLTRVDNPPNPYLSESREWLEPPPPARIEVYHETARSILSKNDSPDLPFTWSLNPYRGCQHACAYCYARPYHEYLGHGAGTDFDTKLVVKTNAPALLRKTLSSRSWRGERIMFSGATDCYQPLEASYQITRQCLEVCAEFANPVGIITKSYLVARDAALIAELHKRAGANVIVSIPFADRKACALIEPQAPPPQRRFEGIRRLTEAGVAVGVMVAPIIPGLTDKDIPRILEQASEAGATSACCTMLRLQGSVEQVFLSRLRSAMPLRADRVIRQTRAVRGGRLSDTRFGERMRGSGVYWEGIKQLFEMSRRRYGLVAVPRDVDAGLQSSQIPERTTPIQLGFDFAEP